LLIYLFREQRKREMFDVLFEKFNRFYETLFFKYGKFLAKYYGFVIVVSFAVNVTLVCGLFQFKLISDPDDLYMTIDSTARKTERQLKNLFNATEKTADKFFVHQLLDLGTWAEINFHVKPDPTANIIDPVYIDEIRRIHTRILDEVRIGSNGSDALGFSDLCAKRFRRCAVDGIGLLGDEFFEFLNKTSSKLAAGSVDEPTEKSLFDSNLIFVDERMTFNDLTFSLGKCSADSVSPTGSYENIFLS
jgi:hypothetical protein